MVIIGHILHAHLVFISVHVQLHKTCLLRRSGWGKFK